MRQVDEQAGIHHQRDAVAVAGDRRLVAKQPVLLLAPRPEADLLGIGGFDVGRRSQMDLAGGAVDDDRVAVLAERDDVRGLADGGDAERAGDDGDMAGRAALLEHQAADALAVVVEEFRRAHVRATMIASRGRSCDDGPCGLFISTRSSRLARSSKSCSRSRRNGSIWRCSRARVSLCTFSTAASAVRPLRIASCMRRTQPRSLANMR